MKNFLENQVVIEDLEKIIHTDEINWSLFANKKVAITGATGLLGRLLTAALLKANREKNLNLQVLAFVRNQEKAQNLFQKILGEDLTFVVQDITKSVPEEIHADYLIHGASVTASKMMVEHPVETIMTTIEGTRSMLEFAARCKMDGMVYLSSMEAYGVVPAGGQEIFEEDLGYINPLEVRSGYSEGKRMAECLCASYAEEFGVEVKMARLAATFGAGIDEKENRAFAQFAKSVLAGTDIVLHTKGDKANCYCYTSDAIKGLIVLLQKGQKGQAYNVANTQTFCSIKEMAETFIEVGANGTSKLLIDIPEDASTFGYAPSSVMRLNASKMMELGWKPEVNMKEMAERLMRSLKAE